MKRGAPIPLARPAVGDGELAAVERALLSGRLVLGPENQRFEEALAEACGRRHAVAVSSGTTALELALWVLDIGPGDEVVVPAFGFLAAANAVRARGAVAVPADVDAAGWNLDPASLASALSPKTRAVVSIDQFGLVAESAELLRHAGQIPVIDDAACGLGGTDSAAVVGGGYGRLATLSFHPRKVITTGEGGAVLCDDDGLADELRQLRNHGQTGRGVFARVGTNARLSEMAAAVGRAQLARLEGMLAERRMLAEGFRKRLAPLERADRLSTQKVVIGAVHAYQTFAVRLAADLDRDAVCAAMAERGIECGPATYAFHRVGSFAGTPSVSLANSDALHDRGLALPLYIGMRSSELDRVVAELSDVLAEVRS